MISLITEGLTSTDQYSLVTQGLKSVTLTSPSIPDITGKFYPETYEGIVQVAAEVLLSNYANAPYPDSWKGIVDAVKDSGRGSGLTRPEGYPSSIRGVIEAIADKFGPSPGLEVRYRFPLTFEGVIQVIEFYLNPSRVLSPYPDTFEGIINVLRDCAVVADNNSPLAMDAILSNNSITVYWEYPLGCTVSNNPPTLFSANAVISNIQVTWKRPDGCV